MTRSTFPLPADWLSYPVSILQIGCGGTGAEMLGVLARMDYALRRLGHPGVNVTVLDDDVVSEANLARQPFLPSDVGQSKAVILTTRLNAAFGCCFRGVPTRFDPNDEEDLSSMAEFDLLIGCTDSGRFRVMLGQATAELESDSLWLDCGNGQHHGQVILGHLGQPVSAPFRLPNVFDHYPDMQDADDDGPSCSLQEALSRQDLFINRQIATCAGELLWRFIREGGITIQGYLVDWRAGTAMVPIAIVR